MSIAPTPRRSVRPCSSGTAAAGAPAAGSRHVVIAGHILSAWVVIQVRGKAGRLTDGFDAGEIRDDACCHDDDRNR
jgi:hypothetical protein